MKNRYIVGLLMILLWGCGTLSPQEQIIGDWSIIQTERGDVPPPGSQITFLKQGIAIKKMDGGEYPGRYQILESSGDLKLQLTDDRTKQSTLWDIVLDDDTLIIMMPEYRSNIILERATP